MKVAVIGGGGREHALVWKLAQSTRVTELFCAPGNPGIAQHATCVPIAVNDLDALQAWVQQEGIDLTIIGPEDPLSQGIVDRFQAAGLPVYGPSQQAAQLESSKSFAKEKMRAYGVPTAKAETFTDYLSAWSYVQAQGAPIVIKADGLAAGKGVTVAQTLDEAENALREALETGRFGDAGRTVVVEEFMAGEEMTVLSFVSGKTFLPMVPSQDHKPVFDRDQGPNTGGMGAYSPVPHLAAWLPEIEGKIVRPMVEGLQRDGIDFQGVLYTGLMLTAEGPKVVEFNVRFGDPEAQVVLPRLQTDLLEVIAASLEGRLHEVTLEWNPRACVCVIAASGGYPGSYEKGLPITGELHSSADEVVFHAGTAERAGALVTNGGRVLNVSALGDDLRAAQQASYRRLQKIHFSNMHYRSDIASKAFLT